MRPERERDFVEYVNRDVRRLRRIAYRLCGDWHRADDVVQGALVLLYRNWRHAIAAASLDAYVGRIVVNVYLEGERRWWARRVVPVPAIPEAAVNTLDSDTRLDLMAALARITPRQRAAVVLRYWEGLDVAATAEAMGCREGTVKSLSSQGAAALRRLLPGYAPGIVDQSVVEGGVGRD